MIHDTLKKDNRMRYKCLKRTLTYQYISNNNVVVICGEIWVRMYQDKSRNDMVSIYDVGV